MMVQTPEDILSILQRTEIRLKSLINAAIDTKDRKTLEVSQLVVHYFLNLLQVHTKLSITVKEVGKILGDIPVRFNSTADIYSVISELFGESLTDEGRLSGQKQQKSKELKHGNVLDDMESSRSCADG